MKKRRIKLERVWELVLFTYGVVLILGLLAMATGKVQYIIAEGIVFVLSIPLSEYFAYRYDHRRK